MIIPKDWMRRSDHPAELLFITLGVESITRLASQNDVRHGKYVAQVQKQARRKGGDGVPPGGDGVPPGGNFSRLVVAFFCKRGHHRSVAGATIFAHVLQATSDSWYPMTTHLCEQLWDVSCDTACPACYGRSDVRGAALAAARDEWRELMST